MSLFTKPRSRLAIREALRSDADRVLEFLERDPAENVFLSHLIRRGSLQRARSSRGWYVAEQGGRIRGVCVSFSNVVPAVDGEETAAELAHAVGRLRRGTQSVVGPRDAVNAMWQVLEGRTPAPRLVREEQPFYVLGRDDPERRVASADHAAPAVPRASPWGEWRREQFTGERRALRLRQAEAADLDLVVTACADMLREEILDDPYARDPVAFRGQVWRLVQDRAIYVGEADGEVVFKAHANVRTPRAVQISGVYTFPEHRSRGYATAAMSALTELLLRQHDVLCLYVNSDNSAAIRTYETVGFHRAGTFKSIFFENGT